MQGKNKFQMRHILMTLILLLTLMYSLSGCTSDVQLDTAEMVLLETAQTSQTSESSEVSETLSEDQWYYSAEDVALYIHLYGQLPENYLTKSQASDQGWESEKGNLWDVTNKAVIGGDRFGNREGLLPDATGRKWYECDVNYEGGFRNAERLVFSNDGLIYYTKDHYKSFEKWYD